MGFISRGLFRYLTASGNASTKLIRYVHLVTLGSHTMAARRVLGDVPLTTATNHAWPR